MSYVEVCKTHGQYHGEICGECYEELKEENVILRQTLREVSEEALIYNGVPEIDRIGEIARIALRQK